MDILTTCLSGLLALTMIDTQADALPRECAALLAPRWTIEIVVTARQSLALEPQVGDLLIHVVSASGCEADMMFPNPAPDIMVGEQLRVKGETYDGMVIVEKVERLAPG